MGPELVLAIDACITESSALVVDIGKKVAQIVKLKKQCRRLGEDAKVLEQMLNKRRAAIQSIETLQDFQQCLENINAFVQSCQTYGPLDRVLEVLWRKKYPALKKEVSAVKEVFIFESITELVARSEITAPVSRQIANSSSVSAGKGITQTLLDLKRNVRGSGDTSNLVSDLELDESVLQWQDSGKTVGNIDASDTDKYVCYKIFVTASTKRNLDIYKDLQYSAYIQRYFGVAKIGDGWYAVMEALNTQNTLNNACLQKKLPTTLPQRLSLAYNVAKTMAWYHKADLCIKSVSDQTVVLQAAPSGGENAIIIHAEHIRHVLERTTGIEYDSRFEAPEYARIKEHTKQTDVWSLGVIIWQFLFGQMPYAMEAPARLPSPSVSDIRRRLEESSLPGKLDDIPEAPGLINVISECWRPDPLLRPTATSIAENLLNWLTKLSLPDFEPLGRSDTLEPDSDPAGFQARAITAIKVARTLNGKSPTFKQSTELVAEEEFQALLDSDEDFNPVTSFVIGAVMFWNLAAAPKELGENMGLCNNPQEARTVAAIYYLESAARSGYDEAFLELYKAHALLARMYAERTK